MIREAPLKKLTIPGATIGVSLFGDNVLGQTYDFFNPLSDIQDVLDLVGGVDDGE